MLLAESTLACDIVSPQVYATPDVLHANYARYRQESPVAWVEPALYRPFWAITKFADIVDIEREHTLFINAPRITLVPQDVEALAAQTMGHRTAAMRSILDMDAPDHRKYRAVAQSWFLGPGVARFQARVDEVCRRWLQHMRDKGGECDFASEIANFVPLSVIMTILGLPDSDMDFVLRSTHQMFAASDPDLRGDSADYGRTVFADLMAYLSDVLEQRRRHPTDDLSSVIAHGVVDGAPMALLESLSYMLITSTGGHETTASALAGGLLALLQHPEQMRAVRENPALWQDRALHEVLRWVTPVRHMLRTATADYALRGHTIRAGDSVALMYLSANRDEEVFERPFVFDVQRDQSRHLAFGSGVHFCLGRMLALAEMRTFFTLLMEQTSHIELAGNPVFAQSNFVGTLKSLPVRYRFKGH